MSQCSGNGRHVGSIQTPGYRLGYHTVCLAQKKQIPMSWSLVRSDRGSNPRSTTLEASTLVIFNSYRDVQHTIFLMSLKIRNVHL
jgi:hypothetical protein